MANGDRIHWEYNQLFDGLTEDEKETMTIDQFMEHELQIAEHNVFETSRDLANRIQDSPEPRGYLNPMSGFVSDKLSTLFFSDTKYLVDYMNAPTKGKRCPRYYYYAKISCLVNTHMQHGELYLECRKCDNGCDYCEAHHGGHQQS